MALPRLTGALRAFSGLSGDASSQNISPDDMRMELSSKRTARAQREAEEGLSWKVLVDTLRKKAKDVSNDNLTSSLRQLTQIAREIVGDGASPDYVEAGAAMLFETFKDSTTVSNTETKRLRGVFGPFPATAATRACQLVHQMAGWLPDHVLDKLSRPESGETGMEKEFGSGIRFHCGAEDEEEDTEWLESEDEEAMTIEEQFDMRYDEKSAPGAGAGPTMDAGWLKRKVSESFSPTTMGMSVMDMCSTIFDLLCSSKSDSALQNDLFELLGFDRFELIQSLLSNRQELVSVTFDKATDMATTIGNGAPRQKEDLRPAFGCQVTIQSEQEKQLRKQYRKEERRAAKRKEDDPEQDEFMKALGFHPEELRAKREAALISAARSPMFSNKARYTGEKVRYPFVFDSYAEAKQTSSFIAGSKMLLPLGFERENNKVSEEVTIPAAEKLPVNVAKLIPINKLDDVGQMAFRGTKSLNRVQSIVFDTAYKTNQNLLICAPTGAGKTNVAMLCILQTIKQHIQQGVIKKDEFKIVYVAPMKALAAEMVRNFGGRLEPLGIAVRELTGDMQLTKAEIMKTQMLVTTPEKWDVVTRKSTGDVALTQIVKLLIIDEVHLLHDDRGAVIESLVARTLRQVESSQMMIRIVGLSATLPNYIDVARFLHVNPMTGLFFFDGRFRPVPLQQTFIGVKSTNRMQQLQDYNTVTYEKVIKQIRDGQQVMVFVHARNETVRTAMVMVEMAKNCGDIVLLQPPPGPKLGEAQKQVSRSRNKQMKELFADGFGIHHAGMLRQDRNLVERNFADGLIRVLVCTATLAWGVNLPAHAVIIKGTQIYNAKVGSFVDLGILDVMQIFGRAGRPQFDTFGHGTIITTHDKLSHYLSLLTQQNPIESQFVRSLVDNLNAEISLGTVTNVEEAVKWLSYTYLFVRMRNNPLVYGIPYAELQDDPQLENHRRELITSAARSLDKAFMVRFDERTGYLHPTDLGRTASHFYIKHDTVEVFNEFFKSMMTEDKVFEMVSKAQEFDQIKVRDEELNELDRHINETCELPVSGGSENTYGKVNILLQTYISRGSMENFSLVSDQAYVAQNAARILRALFEMALRKGWPIMAGRLLNLSKTVEKRLWGFENPLRQFSILTYEIFNKLEARNLTISKLRDLDAKEIGHMIHHVRMGSKVKQCVHQIPQLEVEASVQPITRTVLRVRLNITSDFTWSDRVHGSGSEPFWIWVEDPETNCIYHSEYFMLHKKQAVSGEEQNLVFTIPIVEPLPTQYIVRVMSDRWLGSESQCAISFKHLILPERHPPHTELLNLSPLPISALQDPRLEALYKFTHFNPIQTQIFHTLYHTDVNVLLGAPTGSGKTVAAEMAIFRVFREKPNAKAVYIAPLKALVRERMDDWRIRIEKKLGKKVVELTGDVTPDMRAVAAADLIVTTPEKWDGISRSWQTRGYVKAVTLLVIDEIHLLGNDRGPVLEVIVSRTNFISSHTERKVRVVGLSTALSNARDLADWLGIKSMGLFNFRPSVRPVPLEVHIAGFPGKHYCPRMATMNKPAYQSIRTHSPDKPVMVFVSSRRQTRLTALDLIAFLAADDNPKQWLHLPENEMENIISGIKDTNLKLTLAFGIGLHHAGLQERDRKVVEELFVNSKIQVLVATSTLAWGVNFPAHLVVIKGTEYFDGKTCRYVDFPITDVLQMMGRAGRPQFDDQGKAVILVHDVKKHFYKKFLYEPFPVESNLLAVLAEHLNAEIVAGTINSKQDAMDYITWTYFFRRLVMNPSYYNLDDTDHETVNKFLSSLVERAVFELENCYCLEVDETNVGLAPTVLGRIASYYYLHHNTLRAFKDELKADNTIPELLDILSSVKEYAELPVRHNEDQINSQLATKMPLPVNPHTYDSAHTKAHLLLQAHFSDATLPSSDYVTDLKSVLDQSIRILQAMLDVCCDAGWLVTALRIIHLLQQVIQGRWVSDNTLLCLPHVQTYHLDCFSSQSSHGGARQKGSNTMRVDSLPELMHAVNGHRDVLHSMLGTEMDRTHLEDVFNGLCSLPVLSVKMDIRGYWADRGAEERRPVNVAAQSGARPDNAWLRAHADQEYVLIVDMSRLNRKRDTKAYTPRFPKPKDEGWLLVLGEVESREVLAIKRVGGVRDHSKAQISFYTPERPGRVVYTLYVMSDSYLGLDQQYDIPVDVQPASIEAQVNQEMHDLELDL